jgi:hypothetical protein
MQDERAVLVDIRTLYYTECLSLNSRPLLKPDKGSSDSYTKIYGILLNKESKFLAEYFNAIMKNLSWYLQSLPDEILCIIFSYLISSNEEDVKAVNELSSTCRQFYLLMRPRLIWLLVDALIKGDQNRVNSLIEISPDVVCQYTRKIIDYSGRCFDGIVIENNCIGFTALQCALWSLDMPMWNMILTCILNTKVINLSSKIQLLTELLRQYNQLITYGMTYTSGSTQYTEKHFQLTFLISALEEYMAVTSKWSWDKMDELWITLVGKAQLEVTAVIAQHLCDPSGFSLTSSFDNISLNRSFYCTTINQQNIFWFPRAEVSSLGKHGVNFAFCRGQGKSVLPIAKQESMQDEVKYDIEVLKELNKKRLLQFFSFGEKLQLEIKRLNKIDSVDSKRLASS